MRLRLKITGMKVSTKKQMREPMKRGTKPELLKLNGNWQDLIKKSFLKKRPAAGWPTN